MKVFVAGKNFLNSLDNKKESGIFTNLSLVYSRNISIFDRECIMSLYKINHEKHKHLIDEFRENPIGMHSPALQKILNVFRGVDQASKYVLIVVKPHEEWMLAQLGEGRGDRLKLHKNKIYYSIEDAEWDIFKLRWKHYTGESIND